MNSDNIISVNIPNGVSIVVMMFVGGIVLAFIRKAVLGKAGSGSVGTQGVFTS